MKQLKLFFMSVVAIACLGLMTSCGGDDDDNNNPQPAKSPILELTSGSPFTSSDKTINGGEAFETRLSGKSAANSGKSLKNVTITVSYDGNAATTILDSAITGTDFNYTFKGTARSVAGTEKWTFTITDSDNLSASQSFTLTTNQPAAQSPTLDFISGSQYVTADVAMTGGQPFETALSGKANATSGSNLKNLKITVSYNGSPDIPVLDSTINLKDFNHTFRGFTRSANGTEKWTFTITDSNNLTASRSFTITTTDPNPGSTISVYQGIILGAQSTNAYSAFFSSQDGTVNTVSQAKANQPKIDFIYFYDTTNLATLAAPNDPEVNTIGTYQLNTWSTKNATTFKTSTLPAAIFDAVANSSEIATGYNFGTNTNPTSRASKLLAGQVIGFKTQAGKMGIIKIVSINPGSSGSITIDIKVQK